MTMREIKNELMSLNEDHLEALYRNLSRQDITILGKHSILATQPDLDKETKINLMSENITEPSVFCKKINDSLKDVNVRLFSAEGSSPEDIWKLKSALNKISNFGNSGDKENIVDLTLQLALQLGKLDNSKESLKFPRNQ